MSIEQPSSVEETVISIIRSYVGKETISREKLIGSDLGLSGGDSVEFLDELEEKFGVYLNPLVDQATVYLKPNWYDRLRGRTQGSPAADVTVADLIQFIETATRAPFVTGPKSEE